MIPARSEVRLVDSEPPIITSPTQVEVRTLEVGICRTDREICTFVYGTPPDGCERLVLGHEALGEVVDVGAGVQTLKRGDLVVPSVRRPCPDERCRPCREGRQDFCITGGFTERGIHKLHGFLCDSFVEEEQFLSQVPRDLADVAVLTEPLTIAEKGLTQAYQVQGRLPWGEAGGARPRGAGLTAVVVGAGPIGILGTMKLLHEGFEVLVYSRSRAPNPKQKLVESLGARYVSSLEHSSSDLAGMAGRVDLVYEAAGEGAVTFAVLDVLGTNGVFVLTGIPAPRPAIPVFADMLMRGIALRNLAIVGTVNADRPAFDGALRDLGLFKRRWPDAFETLITGRHPIDAYRDLLLEPATGIKNLIRIAGGDTPRRALRPSRS